MTMTSMISMMTAITMIMTKKELRCSVVYAIAQADMRMKMSMMMTTMIMMTMIIMMTAIRMLMPKMKRAWLFSGVCYCSSQPVDCVYISLGGFPTHIHHCHQHQHQHQLG